MSSVPRTRRLQLLDASAIGLSGLCLAHCLLLPLAASLLPLAGAWAQSEWVHVAFATAAVPLALLGLWRSHRGRPLPGALWSLAGAGMAALVLGAAGWPAEAWERPLTVAGALALASAHAWNWARRHAAGRACG